MPGDDVGVFIKALNDIGQSAGFAQKYGPFFFAVALLVVTPFVARAVFQKSIQRADKNMRQRAYEDFRFYFRATVAVGIICVFAGVGWWLYDSYREGSRISAAVAELKEKLTQNQSAIKNMNFTHFGIIGPGLKAHDVFFQTQFTDELSIVFAKLPSPLPNSEASWLFVILSPKELASPLNFSVGWTSGAGAAANPDPASQVTLMPVSLIAAKNTNVYKFSLDGRGDRALIQPVGDPN
jgi:hypothetical protein